MTPASAWRSWAPDSPPPASPATARPSRSSSGCRSATARRTRCKLGAFCVSEPDAGSDVSGAAHPRRLRRGHRRVGAQRHQGVDHQRRHRRRPRRRRRRRSRAQGPRPGELRRPAGHEGPEPGPEVPEARHPRVAHGRGRARRRPRPGQLPARRQGEARRQAGPRPRARPHRREAAGDVDVRGDPPDRRRPGARHRPRRLRVRPRLRQGAQGVRPADHHEPGHRLQAGQHDHRDRRRPAADLAGRLARPQRRLHATPRAR